MRPSLLPRLLVVALLALATMLVAGCSGTQDKRDETVGWSANKLYSEAKDAMGSKDWSKAIKYLEKLEARFPYGRFAQQAQLEIAYCYYKENEPRLGGRRGGPLHQTSPQPPERRLRLLPQGPGELQRGGRTVRPVLGPGHDRTRPQGRA